MQFEINFQEQKKVEEYLKRFKKIAPLKEIMLVLIVIVVVATLILGYLFSSNKKTPVQNSELIEFERALQRINSERKAVSKSLRLLQEIGEEKIIWSEKLWALANATPDELCLTGMEIKTTGSQREKGKGETLIIRGTIPYQKAAEEMDSIQQFIKNLSEDSLFKEDFQSPLLVSVKNSRLGVGGKRNVEFRLEKKQKFPDE